MTVIQNMQRFSTAILQRSQLGRDFSGLRIFRLPLMKKAPAACSITIYTFFVFFILFVAAAFISFFCFSSRVTTKTSLPWSSICFGQELSVTSLVHDHMSSIDYFYLLQFIFLVNNSERKAVPISENHRKTPRPIVVPLNCSARNLTQTCPGNYPTTFDTDLAWKPVCPDYSNINFFFFFLSETNIFIHQTNDKYKKDKHSFKDVQKMVESNHENHKN